jgi:hypothetical protein
METYLALVLNYKENGDDITASFRVSEETLRLAQNWWIQTPNATIKDLSDWVETNAGKLHSADGPAVIERDADGSIGESYYNDGKLHRVDGPAVFVRKADGSTREWYYADGKRHRADGPAVIERHAGGLTFEGYFVDDKPVCGELLISPESAIRHTQATPINGNRQSSRSRSATEWLKGGFRF